MAKSDVVSVPFISGNKYQYNASSGDLWERAKPPPGFLQALMQEVGVYVNWWHKNFYLFNTAAGYRVSDCEFHPVNGLGSQILARNPR